MSRHGSEAVREAARWPQFGTGPRHGASSSPSDGVGLAPLLTIRGLAELLGISEKTVRRMVAARRVPCVRFGRQIRFLPGDVFRWLEARKEG